MSSSQRLQWLLGEVHNGRNAHVTFSYNVQYKREKVKFVLEESYAAGGVYRPCVMAALCAIQSALLNSIVTDKGHKSYRDNRSIVEFWIQQVRECISDKPVEDRRGTSNYNYNEHFHSEGAIECEAIDPGTPDPCEASNAGTPHFGPALASLELNNDMQVEMDAARQMLEAPRCQHLINDVVTETNVTVDVPDSISVDIVKLVAVISDTLEGTLASQMQLPGQQGLSERISVLNEKLAVKFSGAHEVVSLLMHSHVLEVIDLRDALIVEYKSAVAAFQEHSCPSSMVDVSTSASAGSPTRLSSTDVQQEQRQQSSSFPRDIQRTDQLASPRKKKSKKH